MNISIVIPTPAFENNIEYLETCIKSIKKYQTIDHEIIVVVNGLNGKDVSDRIKNITGIKLIKEDRQGQCISVNVGVKNATNEYILISDDDVVFPPNWEELTEKAKEVDFLSGVFMENVCKGSGHCEPFVICSLGCNPQEFRWEEFEKKAIELREERWQNGFGFPIICKKSLWEEIGGYDENYDPWGSNCDSDLEYKIMLRGIMPMRWRGVLTYHFSNVSGTFTNPKALPYWDKNKRYFTEKWGIIRASIPAIWLCDFKIDGHNLKFKPSWAKLYGNPNIAW